MCRLGIRMRPFSELLDGLGDVDFEAVHVARMVPDYESPGAHVSVTARHSMVEVAFKAAVRGAWVLPVLQYGMQSKAQATVRIGHREAARMMVRLARTREKAGTGVGTAMVAKSDRESEQGVGAGRESPRWPSTQNMAEDLTPPTVNAIVAPSSEFSHAWGTGTTRVYHETPV